MRARGQFEDTFRSMGDTRSIPVSVILTTLNEEAGVPLFFKGIRESSVFPADIVICDGGSSDDTVTAIERESACFPVRLIVEPGASIARGRNAAIALASQEILAITDAGCRIDRHWLEYITAPLLERSDVDAVGGGYGLEGERWVQRCTAYATLPLERHDAENFLPSSRSFAVRKSAFLRAGGYPEALSFAGEDTALCLRMKELGMRFVTRWDAVVHWELRPTMRSFLRQYYFYGVGDGEARSLDHRYRRMALKWGGAMTLALSAAVTLWTLLALCAGLAIYAAHLYRTFRWKRLNISQAFCGFIFVLLKEAAQLVGYVKGRLSRRENEGMVR